MSIFRISLIAVIIGVVFLVGAAVAVLVEQQSYRAPLVIDAPTGAVRLGEVAEGTSGTRSTVFYETTQSVDDVLAHYDRLMSEFYDTNPNDPLRERCRRTPAGTAVYANFQVGNGTVPFEYKCLFERSGINVTQETLVIFQPGVRNDADGTNNEGKTMIYHEQFWAP